MGFEIRWNKAGRWAHSAGKSARNSDEFAVVVPCA